MNSVHFVSGVIFEGIMCLPRRGRGTTKWWKEFEGVLRENSPSVTTASRHLPRRGRLLASAENLLFLPT